MPIGLGFIFSWNRSSSRERGDPGRISDGDTTLDGLWEDFACAVCSETQGFRTHDSKDRAWNQIDFEVARVVRSYETDEQYRDSISARVDAGVGKDGPAWVAE